MNNDIKNTLASGVQPGSSATFRTITTNPNGGDVRAENITVYRDADRDPNQSFMGWAMLIGIMAVVANWTKIVGWFMMVVKFVLWVAAVVAIVGVAYFIYTKIQSSEKELDKDETN